MLAAIRESWWPLERWNFLQKRDKSILWMMFKVESFCVGFYNDILMCFCWLLMINSNCNLLPELFEGVPRNKRSKKRISQRLINLRIAILHMHNHTCWGRVIWQCFTRARFPILWIFSPIPGWFATPEGRRQRRQDTWWLGGGWESSTWTWHSSASWLK